MSITIKKTINITDDTKWFIAAPPKGRERQWLDGYSAKELAKFATSNSSIFSDLIKNIVKNSFKGRISASFDGEPEAETKLPPKGSNGPRNHDLLLYNKHLVIGIEAKVNEPFGASIYDELKKAESENRTDMIERIKWLKSTILPDSEQEKEESNHLKYQLFTATAGALLETYRRNLNKCIVLILSFRAENMEPNNDNQTSFNSFVNTVCKEGNKRTFKIRDYNSTDEIKEIECVFLKQDIVISKSYIANDFNPAHI